MIIAADSVDLSVHEQLFRDSMAFALPRLGPRGHAVATVLIGLYLGSVVYYAPSLTSIGIVEESADAGRDGGHSASAVVAKYAAESWRDVLEDNGPPQGSTHQTASTQSDAPTEVWYSHDELAKLHGQRAASGLTASTPPGQGLPAPPDVDQSPASMPATRDRRADPVGTATAVTLESILGHRCIDWNPAHKWAARLWTCKTKKGTWFEAPYQRLEKRVVTAAVGNANPETEEFQLRLSQDRIKFRCLEELSNSDVSFVECKSDAPSRAGVWRFEHRVGRHKSYGVLVNAKSGSCLSRSRANDQLLNVVTEQCSVDSGTTHWNCRQLWAMPVANTSRSMNRIEAERRPPPPPPAPQRQAVREDEPRVVCWILTYPKTHANRAVAVHRTWGRHCNVLLFMTTLVHEGLPTVVLDLGGPESRSLIFTKTKLAWMHVHKHHLSDGDFFLKADDDTYVVWDHLMTFLSDKSPSEPRYFGRQFVPGSDESRSYYSGGAGYILTRAALARLGDTVEGNVTHAAWATPSHGPEDAMMSASMRPLGINTERGVGKDGRELFLPMGTGFEQKRLQRDEKLWLYQKSPHTAAGAECCSVKWVTTHYMSPEDIYRIDDLEAATCCDTFPAEWPHLQLGRDGAC